jgi:hypothetical protein
MTPSAAETLSLKALTWLASRPDDLARFLATTGLGPQDLRARASDADVLASVLDYLMAHEGLAAGFCSDEVLSSRDVHLARHVLADGR